ESLTFRRKEQGWQHSGKIGTGGNAKEERRMVRKGEIQVGEDSLSGRKLDVDEVLKENIRDRTVVNGFSITPFSYTHLR
ncbi:hypothetical protein KSH90_023555, partial [Escherichia coli]|nr:hypothetical protein [Escherichia coli]